MPIKGNVVGAHQTQHPVGQAPAIVTKAGGLPIGLGGHLTGACDCEPLAAWGLGIPLNSQGWAPTDRVEYERNQEWTNPS